LIVPVCQTSHITWQLAQHQSSADGRLWCVCMHSNKWAWD